MTNAAWSLDRCKVEQTVLGDVIRAAGAYHRHVEDGIVAEETAVVLEHNTFTGYEVGVLAKARDGGVCAVVWLPKE